MDKEIMRFEIRKKFGTQRKLCDRYGIREQELSDLLNNVKWSHPAFEALKDAIGVKKEDFRIGQTEKRG